MNVVITGTSRGIGLELTRQALNQGHSVLAVARDPGASHGLKSLGNADGKLTLLAVDLRADNAPEKIAAAAEKAFPKGVDILINNAGVYKKGAEKADFLESFEVNSVTPYLVTQALLSQLKASKDPRAVHITSLMGSITDNGSGGAFAYRASKSALNMINKCLAIENSWLTTIVVHPGWVQTDMGGQGAPTTPEESAAGIWKVATSVTHAKSGEFKDFRGKELPW